MEVSRAVRVVLSIDGVRDQPTETAEGELDARGGRVRQLRVVHGAADRSVIVLGGEPIVVGREAGPDGLTLDDHEASRRHARFTRRAGTDGGWSVEDLGSRNGTFVDGARLANPVSLAPGAVVRVGKTLLVYVDAELRAQTPLAREAPPLLGASLAMQRVRGEIERVAQEALPVLIVGETGVGKELVAEQLHARSGRRGPFVPVNCAAIPAELAESELFGHVAGAFTGATQRGEGLFMAAQGGTLFLDEIGEMPPAIQPKLLRALAVGEVRPVGSTEARRVDVRVVAATLRDLGAEESAGRFREDLLARLAGWTIRVPPLRERREDILGLANAILRRQPDAPEPSADAAEALLLHGWPRNVRELEQVLAAAAVRRANGGPIRCEHLPPEIGDRVALRAARPHADTPAPPSDPGGKAPLEALVPNDTAPTRADLCLVLEHFAGNVAQVASYFGKDRHQIYRWAERMNVDLETFRRK
jgi:DNA-binding NtrC family response regulator